MEEDQEGEVTIETVYSDFLKTTDLLETIEAFNNLCDKADIIPKNYKTIFSLLKTKLKSWKCQTLFGKLEKKSKHVDYKNKPCAKQKVLVIGSGPVGLRLAIEAAFLGAHVMVIEKRDSFSRNNVLHLWPFLIVDLKALGIKSFFGKFCAGSLDHISIRRLQCILLKMCLLLGVQIFPKTLFVEPVEPKDGNGWRIKVKPESSPLNSIDFDVLVGCDGKNNSLNFERKEFRGKLAIAITCNFVNKQTSEEARVEEISGVALIYNQDFFRQLTEQTGVELENIVYYKDETHYFVMTAKKKSLLSEKVIKQDSKDVFKLLSADNINHNALLKYAKQAADFATKYQLPHHEFAVNHYGKEDVAMFDFTSIHQARNASRILERKGKRLLLCIAGDVLLEPFWPTGSGCARGFLSAFDAAWMVRGFGLGQEPVDLIQERESIFTILAQTKPDTLIRHQDKYSINPATRYLNLHARVLSKDQVAYLYDTSTDVVDLKKFVVKPDVRKEVYKPVKVKKAEVDPDTLLKWCKEQTKEYPNVEVVNMSSSWRSGLAFCAIINRYRPSLLDYFSLDPDDVEANCEKAFTIAEEHLGIPPKISAHDLATNKTINTLAIMAYVSLYYETLSHETPVLIFNESINQIEEDLLIQTTPRLLTPSSISSIQSPRDLPTLESPRVFIPPTPPVPRSPRRFGFRIALVAKKSLKIPKSDGGEDTSNPVPSKSPVSKMSILSKLSKRSKQRKSKLDKKSRKDKENKLMSVAENGVVLKSYEKSPIGILNESFSAAEQSEISSSDDSPVKKTFPLSPVDANSFNMQRDRKENISNNGVIRREKTPSFSENDAVRTTGADKFKRISQLAESVFGDTIVQQGAAQKRDMKSSVENLTESEKCHFCSRKVYVMERQSAEGLFFHRKCFRCCVCKCHLLIGNYAYDAGEDDEAFGKFYCKMHYNRLIYQPKESTPQPPPQQAIQQKRPSDKKRRPQTQLISRSDVNEAFRQKSTDSVQLSPKFSRQIRDIQSELKTNLPQMGEQKKRTSTFQSTEEIDGGQIEEKGGETGPYDRFEARSSRSLLDRHPSLLKCSPQKDSTQKVTTKSFFTSSKFSVSTPNLTKLIQEDSMFEEERKMHEEKITNPSRKKLQVSQELISSEKVTSKPPMLRKKLSVPDSLRTSSVSSYASGTRESLADEYDAEDKRNRHESLASTDSYGAVHRRPMDERRAQYPVSMAFTDGLIAAGFNPVSVSIDIDEPEPPKEEKPKKKKKLVLKKKKAKKEKTIIEEEEEEPSKAKSSKEKQKSFEHSFEKSSEKSPKLGKKKDKKQQQQQQKQRDDDWVLLGREDAKAEDDVSTSSSEEEEEEKHFGIFRRIRKTKKKPVLSEHEREVKEKKREQKKIRRELKERESKRLWEAQSIQRKLNEVDAKQFELEETAKEVERQLQDETISKEKSNSLMFQWFDLVNEKNTLLRFESELVIQSNSVQLEDRQARLEQQVRDLLTTEMPAPNAHDEVDRLTKELVDTVEQRNALVELLEADRIREMEEDKTLKEVFAKKAHDLGMDRLI